MNDIDIDIRFSNMREMDGMSKVKGGEMNESRDSKVMYKS